MSFRDCKKKKISNEVKGFSRNKPHFSQQNDFFFKSIKFWKLKTCGFTVSHPTGRSVSSVSLIFNVQSVWPSCRALVTSLLKKTYDVMSFPSSRAARPC